MRPVSRRVLLLIACETGLIIAAVWLAAYVRFGSWMWNVMAEQNGMPKALLIAAVCQLCLYYSDLYEIRKIGDRKELLVRIIQALGGASFVLAAVYYWFPASMIGRGVFFLAAGFRDGPRVRMASGVRVAFEPRRPRQRLLLVGIGSAAIKLERELMERRQALGVEIVGFIDADPAAAERPKDGVRVIGSSRGHPGHREKPRRGSRRRQPCGRARQAADGQAARDEAAGRHVRPSGVGLRGVHRQDRRREPSAELADLFVRVPRHARPAGGQARHRRDGGRVRAPHCGAGDVDRRRPRACDVARRLSCIRQTRVGQNGRLFTLYKFRSMRADAEALTGAVWAQPGDASVTRSAGSFG